MIIQDYDSALKLHSLNTLYQRREQRLLNFAVKCVNDKFSTHIFPVNTNPYNREMFKVNFARTNRYFKSTVPQCQRLLNEYARDNPNFIPSLETYFNCFNLIIYDTVLIY